MSRAQRFLFWFSAVWAGCIYWLAPHPPMVDLPQHAGMVRVLADLLQGDSPWHDLIRINWFTPYLLPHGVGAMIATQVPVTLTMKALLTIAAWGTVAGLVVLRKEFSNRDDLDWLFIPGLFGVAYHWGFFTFLCAIPVGLVLLIQSMRHAARPAPGSLIKVTLLGMAVFFCHGLMFVFCLGVGGVLGMLDRSARSLKANLLKWLPYALLGMLAIVYFVRTRESELVYSAVSGEAFWWDYSLWHRLWTFPAQIFGQVRSDLVFLPMAAVFVLAPWVMGMRWNPRRAAWVPFGLLAAAWLVAPDNAMQTGFLFQRFSILSLPLFALLFVPGEATGRASGRRAAFCSLLLAAACTACLAIHSYRVYSFGRESADFDRVLQAAAPQERGLGLVVEKASPVAGNLRAYMHFPLWYQAEKQGWVDFNFAWYREQIVRFRDDLRPAVRMGFEWKAASFNWDVHQGRKYRYFFVRGQFPADADLLQGKTCKASLVVQSGRWSLYERIGCADPAAK